jgi:hypothetical protein
MLSKMSLQMKGLIAFAVLTIYAAGLTLFVLDQKEVLIEEVEQLRSVYEREEAVSQSDLATLRTLQNLRTRILVQSDDTNKESLRDQLGLVRSLYQDLPTRYPGAETTLLSLQGALDEAYIYPPIFIRRWRVYRHFATNFRTRKRCWADESITFANSRIIVWMASATTATVLRSQPW